MRTRQRSIVGLLIAVVTAALVWWTQGDGNTPGPGPGSPPSARTEATAPDASPTHDYSGTNTPATEPSQQPGTDPVSGLPLVRVADLPPEAAATLELIDAGGPFPEDEDGGTFSNREGILPDERQGYYREYTVPTPGSDDRGARRIVAGDGNEYYWTEDHYSSFESILR